MSQSGRSVLVGLGLVFAVASGGCSNAPDRGRIELCRRVIESLHAPHAAIDNMRASSMQGGVKLDYVERVPGEGDRAHFVVCRFSGGADARGHFELESVETDRGRLGEARLLFLKRFWLAPPRDAPRIPDPDVPQISASAAYAAQSAVSALPLMAIYGLLACAYSLLHGLIGRINLAFGDLAVVGAYGAVGGMAAAFAAGPGLQSFDLALAFAIAVLLSAIWSDVVGRMVIAPLHARYRTGQPILVATVAVSICIQEFLRLFQGARERWLPPVWNDPIPLAKSGSFVVTVTPVQLLVVTAAFAGAGTLLLLIARTSFGRQWRAFADDPLAAALLGVNPAFVLSATFVLAGLNAGLAGWVVAVHYGNVSFSMGTILSLKALLAALVGGIGRLEAAFLGGILIGLLEASWSAYFDIASRDLVVFSLLIAVFVLRPGGLFGDVGPRMREV
ncbi:MAG: branched-chain amino acid ABC transporter permease [Pseudorhodoplanes sp.]|nr:branched-chain amino acid ABC transporter permease [Pseudorhodoplanes sp.]